MRLAIGVFCVRSWNRRASVQRTVRLRPTVRCAPARTSAARCAVSRLALAGSSLSDPLERPLPTASLGLRDRRVHTVQASHSLAHEGFNRRPHSYRPETPLIRACIVGKIKQNKSATKDGGEARRASRRAQ